MLRSTTPSSGDITPHFEGSEIEALRGQISTLSSEVVRIAAGRVEAVKRVAVEGSDYARETVDDYPFASLALAFGAGALLGLAVLPPRRDSSDWRHASVNSLRDDLTDYTKQMKRSIRSSAAGRGLMSNLERVADTVSSVDAKATIGPVWNRIVSWLEVAKSRASTAAADMTKGS